jgi:cytochrome c biogenesis protein CcmG/thiol:disulfide interchange protein DsbE
MDARPDPDTAGGIAEAPAGTGPNPGRRQRRGRFPLVATLSLGLSVVLLAALAWNLTRPTEPPVERFEISGAPQQPASLPFQRLPAGTAAPPLNLRQPGGGTVDLAALRGRPVVVNFWAVWCEPCKREFPLLRQAYAEHRADGLEIIGVAVRTDEASARDYARAANADWRIALDQGDRTAAAWRASALPQTFFVRPDGTIASHQIGELGSAGMREQLDAILPPAGQGGRP